MPQYSVPLVGENLSDQDWRDLGLGEAGVVADYDGSAYELTTVEPDIINVGSDTQRSVAHVGNFAHVIPMGEIEPVTVPAAVSAARTDIIALRYDPTFTGDPGPVRLVVITGTTAGLPTYDDESPGLEDLPLWAITREVGQSLAAAVKRRLYTRLAPSLDLPDGANLPLSSPLGTVARQGATTYRRVIGSSQVPAWVQDQYVQSAAPASAPDGSIWFQVT